MVNIMDRHLWKPINIQEELAYKFSTVKYSICLGGSEQWKNYSKWKFFNQNFHEVIAIVLLFYKI